MGNLDIILIKRTHQWFECSRRGGFEPRQKRREGECQGAKKLFAPEPHQRPEARRSRLLLALVGRSANIPVFLVRSSQTVQTSPGQAKRCQEWVSRSQSLKPLEGHCFGWRLQEFDLRRR